MTNIIKTTGLYGITHALIDAACVITLYSTIIFNGLSSDWSFAIIVFYNLIAFGTQSTIGNIFDKLKKPRLCAIIGCILTAMSILFIKNPILSVICASFGNSFFHVGGGIICLKLGENKSAIPGMYVAPGAIGLFIGMCIAKEQLISPYIFTGLLIIMAILIYLDTEEGQNSVQKIKEPFIYNKFILITVFLLSAIAIRSFIGLSIVLSWKDNLLLAGFLTLAIALGKFFGGIIADKFGWLKITIIALLISSPLIAFGINSPLLFITGMFFFNFTMPVTLTAISNIMPHREGFAFGLTTLTLIIGAFPTFYNIKLGIGNEFIIFGIVIISAILIFFGLREYFKTETK